MRDIIFCSVDVVATLPDKHNTALISILDASEEYSRPDVCAFADALVLQFQDVSEESKKCFEDFGDYPDSKTTGKYTDGPSEALFNADHARAIVAFFDKCQRNSQVQTLAVHCYAGLSRSAAVAQFLSDTFAVDLDSCKGTAGANPRVLRVLKRTYCSMITK